MGKISAVFKLTRFEHSVMLIIAVVAAELISGIIPPLKLLVLSLLTPVLISAGAFAINDYFDIAVDKANKKRRPLVTGELKPSDALWITLVCMIAGVFAASAINIYCLEIAVIFAALSILYSYRLKEMPLIGNMYVAFSMAIPFIFGNYVVSSSLNYAVTVIFCLIFISGVAREIDGTIRDYYGDLKMRKVNTLPKVIGLKNSAYFALILYAIAVILSICIFLVIPPFSHNAVYLLMILISDLLLLYSGMVFVLKHKSRYNFVRNASLAGMTLALLCIFISALVNIQIPF